MYRTVSCCFSHLLNSRLCKAVRYPVLSVIFAGHAHPSAEVILGVCAAVRVLISQIYMYIQVVC